MNIRFYSHHIQPPAVASFSAIVDAPWGEHCIRGRIIRSEREETFGDLIVLWPKWGDMFSNHPIRHDDSQEAERMITDEFRRWEATR